MASRRDTPPKDIDLFEAMEAVGIQTIIVDEEGIHMVSRRDTPPNMFEWKAGSTEEYFDFYFNGQRIGWLAKRPAYCDRGRWQFNSELPLLDEADGFPRYYMNFERAKAEAEEWSKWKMQSS